MDEEVVESFESDLTKLQEDSGLDYQMHHRNWKIVILD